MLSSLAARRLRLVFSFAKFTKPRDIKWKIAFKMLFDFLKKKIFGNEMQNRFWLTVCFFVMSKVMSDLRSFFSQKRFVAARANAICFQPILNLRNMNPCAVFEGVRNFYFALG